MELHGELFTIPYGMALWRELVCIMIGVRILPMPGGDTNCMWKYI